MTRFAALDLSPDGTAITIWQDATLDNVLLFSKTQKWEKNYLNYFVTVPKVSKGNEQERIERLDLVSGEILDFILSNNVDYVCLEDYAYGKTTGSQYQIAELGGVIRLGLYKHIPVRTHDPMSLKLFWAKSGKATKYNMCSVLDKSLEFTEFSSEEIKDFVYAVRNDYYKLIQKRKNIPDKPTGHPFEGLADSVGLYALISMEDLFRIGEIQIKDMSESAVRVFNRVTKNIPYCLIDRDFLYGGK